MFYKESSSRGQLRLYKLRVRAKKECESAVDKSKTGAEPTRKSRFVVDIRNLAVLRMGNKTREEILLYLPVLESMLTISSFKVRTRVFKLEVKSVK